MISLMVLGILAVLLFIVTLIGIKIPLISGYRRAFVAMAMIIASKWLIVHLTTCSVKLIMIIITGICLYYHIKNSLCFLLKNRKIST